MSNIWANLLTILVGGLLVNNFVMNRFLGCCPFLGVSKQYDTAKGMSMAVIFVMTLASFITWFVQHHTEVTSETFSRVITNIFTIHPDTALVDIIKA